MTDITKESVGTQLVKLVPEYDYQSGKLMAVTIKPSTTPSRQGASINIEKPFKYEKEFLHALNLSSFRGWHVSSDENHEELIFKCDPTDSELLDFLFDNLEKLDALPHEVKSAHYDPNQKRTMLRDFMAVEPGADAEHLLHVLQRAVERITAEDNIPLPWL